MNQAQRRWVEIRIGCLVDDLIAEQVGERPDFPRCEQWAKAVRKHQSLFIHRCEAELEKGSFTKVYSIAETLPSFVKAKKQHDAEYNAHKKRREMLEKKYAARVNDIMLRISMGEIDADTALKLLRK